MEDPSAYEVQLFYHKHNVRPVRRRAFMAKVFGKAARRAAAEWTFVSAEGLVLQLSAPASMYLKKRRREPLTVARRYGLILFSAFSCLFYGAFGAINTGSDFRIVEIKKLGDYS